MSTLTDNDLMPWGLHKGKKMTNMPAHYLIWLYNNNKCWGDVKAYIEDNLDALQKEIDHA